MSKAELYVVSVLKNCHDYLLRQITIDDIEQINYNTKNLFFDDIEIAKLVLMYKQFKDNYSLQLMNNIIHYSSLNVLHSPKVISFHDSVSINKQKIAQIGTSVIAYMLDFMMESFYSFKQLIEQDDFGLLIENAYVMNYLYPIDLYYCSKYFQLEPIDETMRCFFDFADKKINFKKNNFGEKLKENVKTIIKKFESVRY